ncbi:MULTISPECIES: ABC transporter ATP-binding protein [Rhizobium]|uniref:ABC transporter ATP-binding protein n=1 Tax=Rhizobium rhododendri TaxID=2506430 RepID=A0ABY8IRS0_9HYPH|nr:MULTISPECIES: ABC transporter ATP-binding protein [Rhizobium]WFS26274.1 ABC transporter ATP-binding protein [Rhizobium rhododendri]
MIRFEQVDIAYDGKLVVPNLNLSIKEGEFFTLLGPSGCGKSTILRCLAGFVPITKGRIMLGDSDISRIEAERRGVGIVFQNYALFPHLTIAENVAFGLRASGASKADVAGKVAHMLERTGISELAKERPAELSGGQQQRVAISRSLVMGPKILLMDEPLSNLDVKLRVSMRDEIKRLQQHIGFTTIYVTHDQEEALSLSDRIAVLNSGSVEQIGSPEAIYNKPETEFVCHFIGEANRMTPAMLAEIRADGGDAPAFVRPEDMSIGSENPNNYRIIATVANSVFLGALVRYRMQAADGHFDLVMSGTEERLPVGSQHAVSFQQNALLRPARRAS